MSRYLTPQKISLLVLVNLYCDSALPLSATIPILSFIITHVIPSSPFSTRKIRAPGFGDVAFSIQAFDELLSQQASSMPGRTLLDVFLKKMWEINSFDALHELFDGLGNMLIRTVEEAEQEAAAGVVYSPDQIFLSRTSPLGAFIRRASLEFSRLQFHDGMRLWFAFVNYRAPTAQWTRRIAGIAGTGIDITAIDMGLKPGDPLYDVTYGQLDDFDAPENMISLDDLNRVLDQHVDQIQTQGCRLPDEVKKQLRTLLGPSGTVLKQSHLVKFLDAWKAGDYTSSFDNLHRYYDYAMQTRDKGHYQYALLHMAVLQADFGCFSEAVAAINETIATARENNDQNCLFFSLNWLNHMSKAYPKQMKQAGHVGVVGSERDGLLFLKAKAKDNEMWSLLGSALLSEARMGLSNGDSVPRVFEHIYQASHLNIRHHGGNYGGQMLMMSTLYSRLGITHLSGVYSFLLLDCFSDHCSSEERLRALCRCAFTAAQGGQYDEALRILQEEIDPSYHRVLKFHQNIYSVTGLIKLRRAIARNDTLATTHLLQILSASTQDPELLFNISQLRIESYILTSDFPAAFNLIEDLATTLKEESADIFQRVSILIAKATLFAKAGMPERGFSVALRAASVAFRAKLMPSLWEAVGALGHILNCLGESGAARKLLDAVIPQALESKDLSLCAQLYSYQADALIGLAGEEDPSTPAGLRLRLAKVNKAEFFIDRARACYKRMEDINGECEMLAKKALIAKFRGDEKLAQDWAENYNKTYDEAIERVGGGVGEMGLAEA